MTLVELRTAMTCFATRFDPAAVPAEVCARVVGDAAAIENMAATVKALAAARVADTELWRRRGDRSPAHALARQSGTSVGEASAAIATGKKLASLPTVDQAARNGELSASQAAAITDAATAAAASGSDRAPDPAVEQRLVAKAKNASLGELRDECLKTKAASRSADETHRRIKNQRRLRTFTDGEGAWNLTMRDTPEAGAEIMSVLDRFRDRRFHLARKNGQHEPSEAYAADAMLDMARTAAARTATTRDATKAAGATASKTGAGANSTATSAAGRAGTTSPTAPSPTTATEPNGAAPVANLGGDVKPSGKLPLDPPAPPPTGDIVDTDPPDLVDTGPPDTVDDLPAPVTPTKIIVRIDWDALMRGWPIDGEVSEIAGVGPVPVSAVRAMIDTGDPFLAAVATKGHDVANVAHLGRHPTAHQRTGIEWLHPTCVVDGCNAAVHLEIDHRRDWADTKITLLGWLDRLCSHHHDKKTRHNWQLVNGVGKRPMVPPDDPRHPWNQPASKSANDKAAGRRRRPTGTHADQPEAPSRTFDGAVPNPDSDGTTPHNVDDDDNQTATDEVRTSKTPGKAHPSGRDTTLRTSSGDTAGTAGPEAA